MREREAYLDEDAARVVARGALTLLFLGVCVSPVAFGVAAASVWVLGGVFSWNFWLVAALLEVGLLYWVLRERP
jgi:hypothetical protein